MSVALASTSPRTNTKSRIQGLCANTQACQLRTMRKGCRGVGQRFQKDSLEGHTSESCSIQYNARLALDK